MIRPALRTTDRAPPREAALTIDLAAVAHNYRQIAGLAGKACRTAAVVKADAYGLGAAQAVPALERAGCGFFFVATPEEGVALRGATKKTVAVLNGVFPGGEEEAARHGLWPVLNSLDAVKDWARFARDHDGAPPAILHFDTGMNRLGLGAAETETLLDDPALLQGVDVKIVMSHLACADEADHPLTRLQCERFARIAARFPDALKSLANSPGAFRGKAYHFDLLRPGMALYGLNPTPERPNPMQPAVALEAPVLQVRQAGKGESAGYGATVRFEKGAALATVALGYADGFLRSLGNSGTLYHKGRACPVRGRVSMDSVVVETGGDVRPGDMLEVLGPHQGADVLAAAAGTIGYEILTSFGRRCRRVYKS